MCRATPPMGTVGMLPSVVWSPPPPPRAVKHGVFYFQHKREQRLKYVGRSHNVYESLITMYHRLFELPDRSLSPMEVELKYYHPDASEWIVRVSTTSWAVGRRGRRISPGLGRGGQNFPRVGGGGG